MTATVVAVATKETTSERRGSTMGSTGDVDSNGGAAIEVLASVAAATGDRGGRRRPSSAANSNDTNGTVWRWGVQRRGSIGDVNSKSSVA